MDRRAGREHGGILGTVRELASCRDALAATLRATFHVSLSDIGSARLRWGEALALIRVAAQDTSTYLGARLAGLDYPAQPHEVGIAMSLLSFSAKDDQSREHLFARYLPTRTQGTRRTAGVSDEQYRNDSIAMLERFGIDPADIAPWLNEEGTADG